MQIIPDYDRKINWTSSKHGDINVDSSILGLRVAFLWRPLINDIVLETTRLWATSEHIERPDFILISTIWQTKFILEK